jgi:hypothetical protein
LQELTEVPRQERERQPDPPGEPTKTWTLPPSTAFSVVDFVNYGVRIIASNGDPANAGGNVANMPSSRS